MSKFKNLVLALLTGFVFLVFPTSVSAEDMRVVCSNEGPCNIEFGSPLFDEDAVAPGDSVSKQIMAVNQDDDETCDLTLYIRETSPTPAPGEPADFTSKLFTAIKEGTNILYGVPSGSTATDDKTLEDLLGYGGPLSLGSVPPGENRFIDWIVTFDESADNDYQALTAQFDFDISFECGSPPSPQTQGAATSSEDTGGFFFQTGLVKSLVDSGEADSEEGLISEPEVKGKTCEDDFYLWWLPLLINLIVVLGIFVFYKVKKRQIRRWWASPLLLVIVSQVIHEILGCNCATGVWCPRYIFINLGLLLVSLVLFRTLRRK